MHESELIHASVVELLLILALDRGIPCSIPGRLNLQIKITSVRAILKCGGTNQSSDPIIDF